MNGAFQQGLGLAGWWLAGGWAGDGASQSTAWRSCLSQPFPPNRPVAWAGPKKSLCLLLGTRPVWTGLRDADGVHSRSSLDQRLPSQPGSAQGLLRRGCSDLEGMHQHPLDGWKAAAKLHFRGPTFVWLGRRLGGAAVLGPQGPHLKDHHQAVINVESQALHPCDSHLH